MSLPGFLRSLLEEGRVAVGAVPAAGVLPFTGEEMAAARPLLEELDRRRREELAGDPPEFGLPAARWGAEIVYRAAQFLVQPAVPEARIRKILGGPRPETSGPAVVYSVDLTLRFLPGLLELGRLRGEREVFFLALVDLARAWPLSSVGVGEIGDVDVSPFVEDDSLRQLYVDRIVERNDLGRLRDPRIERAVRESLGAHWELAPEVSRHLSATTVERS